MPPGQHPPLSFILDESNWLSFARFSRSGPYRPYCESLSWSGLFTERLASLACGEVTVDLVRQGPIADTPDMNRRDVRIWLGDSLAAIASTLISQQVIQAEPWLSTLGNKPIGETLEERLGAQRSDVRYATLTEDSALRAHFPEEPVLWGRRYRYQFDNGELSITEIIANSIAERLFANASRA